MRAALRLFWRLMVRPLAREPVRTALTVLAVALGVGVVLAIDLAGDSAAGSFHSSLETLAGAETLEITATGGVPEALVGTLAALPYDWALVPRIEGFAFLPDEHRTLPLIGLDLVAEAGRASAGSPPARIASAISLADLADGSAVWVGKSLGKRPGDPLRLVLNDRPGTYRVRGVYPDSGGSESAIVMDLAAAQAALGRFGRVDRILVGVPPGGEPPEAWQTRAQQALPEGLAVRPAGAAASGNRRMLAAFRWNLRLLSYIALLVGAFLIYNTISVSVVRRRAEIGIARALGAGRAQICLAFLGEAALIGVAGAAAGIPLGRLMAGSAVRLMGATVSALYVSSRPGEISLGLSTAAAALFAGAAMTLLSAWAPAREAALVAPVEAMARGRREFAVRVRRSSGLAAGLLLAAAAAAASRLPALDGKPVFGYLAALLSVAAGTVVIPAFADRLLRATGEMHRLLGVQALLASRSLAGSLRRTSVLVAALATAVAMMTAVAVMVGSFRETVVRWMDAELPADLYLRPAGGPSADQHPTLSPELVEKISALPGVRAVQRLRAYEITYEGLPALLGSIDLQGPQVASASDFLSGRSTAEVLAELRGSPRVIVSEPFAYKHRRQRGDSLLLAFPGAQASFRVADVYYDYGSERGVILMDRAVLLRYLPDPAPSNLAVFVAPGATPESVRKELEAAASDRRVLVFSNRELRAQAVRIFDRTFAITYALEAVAVLVAVMGVAGALLALVIDRRRELALLRYLGASSAQLRRLILTEAGMLGVLASAAGAVVGSFLSLILIFVIQKQSFGWTIRLHWPLAVLAAALSVVWLGTVLAGGYPARIAVRLNPLEAVHEE